MLRKQFGQIPKGTREKGWGQVQSGVHPDQIEGEIGPALKDGFGSILGWFNGEGMVIPGVENSGLSLAEINRFTKAEYRVTTNSEAGRRLASGKGTVHDLIEAVTHHWEVKDTGERVWMDKAVKHKGIRDPYSVLWHMRVGINLASSHKAMVHSLNEQFGVKSGWINDGKGNFFKRGGWDDRDAVVEDLRGLGWQRIMELDGTHYFPPEAVPAIKRFLEMTAPPNQQRVSELIDKVTGMLHIGEDSAEKIAMRGQKAFDKSVRGWDTGIGVWKGASTIYNPGYYTRNIIGEVMSSWLDGVDTHIPYARANKLRKFAKLDEAKELETVHSMLPSQLHGIIGDQAPQGKEVLLTMKNGEQISIERAHVAWHDQGMTTGFQSTEFAKQATASRIGGLPGVRQIVKKHNSLRAAAESQEDFLRQAHFLDVIAKHPGSFDEAVKDAAAKVRKFHFDYTDFSPFEKAVMVRAFPFYKWTRKGMPLMAGQLFLKPGKMLAYPKAANAASNLLSNQDLSEDFNGFLPNYTGIAPRWLMNMMGWQLGAEGQDSTAQFGRAGAPNIDALNSLTNLPGTGYTLGNPLIKAAAEQIVGHTFGEEPWAGGAGFNVPLDESAEGGDNKYFDESDARISNLLTNLGGPFGTLVGKSIGTSPYGNPNDLKKNDFAQLFGISSYDTFLDHPPGVVNEKKLDKLTPNVPRSAR